MKATKIILAVAVVALIGFFVWKWLVSIDKPKEITPPTNQYITRIEKEIDSLKKSPVNIFCPKFHKDILYHITDYHKQGFLGKSASDNDQWKEILQKNLYSAYAPKFAEQAMYVFGGSSWEIDKIKFIRSEVKTLQSSPYLEQKSAVGTSFASIRNILAKYDEIAGFIFSCNGFSYSCYDLNCNFPDVSDKVLKSRTYLANNLNNTYVNNCTRLKDGLRKVPQALLNRHIAYLRGKIQQNGDKYTESQYNKYQSDYSNNIYTPLSNQIDNISRDIYGIDVGAAQENLIELLDEYNDRATEYYRNNRNV
jgi:hypothetical protein